MAFDLKNPSSIQLGDLVAGRYRVEGVLGEGGFATVFKATHVDLETACALKVMHPQHLQREDLQSRFRTEAKTAAALESRHTVRVRDFGFVSDGVPFMVMEFVRGVTVAESLEQDGVFSEADTAAIALGVLASLSEAHARGVVHRDLKPANIFLTEDRELGGVIARVSDFGIAKLLEDQSANATRSMDGVLCTPKYASPEVLTRKPVPVSDLYSLGHLMAELLEGEAPYHTDNALLSAAYHLNHDAVPFGPLTRSSILAPVIEKACAKPVQSDMARRTRWQPRSVARCRWPNCPRGPCCRAPSRRRPSRPLVSLFTFPRSPRI